MVDFLLLSSYFLRMSWRSFSTNSLTTTTHNHSLCNKQRNRSKMKKKKSNVTSLLCFTYCSCCCRCCYFLCLPHFDNEYRHSSTRYSSWKRKRNEGKIQKTKKMKKKNTIRKRNGGRLDFFFACACRGELFCTVLYCTAVNLLLTSTTVCFGVHRERISNLGIIIPLLYRYI